MTTNFKTAGMNEFTGNMGEHDWVIYYCETTNVYALYDKDVPCFCGDFASMADAEGHARWLMCKFGFNNVR